jgi:hypothetical protein
LQIFTEELFTEWVDDKLGLRAEVEDKLFALWDITFHKLQHEVAPVDLLEWGEIAERYDHNGRMNLKLDAYPELRLLGNRAEIAAFKGNSLLCYLTGHRGANNGSLQGSHVRYPSHTTTG